MLPQAAFAQTRNVPADPGQMQMSFAPLVRQVAPAVVNIHTTRTITRRAATHPFMDDPFFRQFFGQSFGFDFGDRGLSRQKVEGALGSGVIVRPDGLVVTNAHVIRGADEIRVVLADGREFDARLALMDEPSDLALLRIDSPPRDLPHASLRPSEGLEVGDLVLAIGNPFGVGQTVTSGIVSALARSSLNISDFNFFIQTDAAINPGNSGGPLVAMDGAVVGINTAIYSRTGGSLGIGFAIPSEMVESVIAAESGEGRGVVRPWLGITAQGVTADIAESLGLERPGGVLVKALHRASPLHKAGVQVGDVILSLNNRPLRDPSEMKFRMATVRLGERAEIEILRRGKTSRAHVAAVAPPDDPPRQEARIESGYLGGVSVANINPAVAVELNLPDPDVSGVVVVGVDRQSPVTRLVRVGDVIVSLNNTAITTTAALKRAAERPPQPGLNLILERNGQRQQIMLR